MKQDRGYVGDQAGVVILFQLFLHPWTGAEA